MIFMKLMFLDVMKWQMKSDKSNYLRTKVYLTVQCNQFPLWWSFTEASMSYDEEVLSMLPLPMLHLPTDTSIPPFSYILLEYTSYWTTKLLIYKMWSVEDSTEALEQHKLLCTTFGRKSIARVPSGLIHFVEHSLIIYQVWKTCW